MAPSVRVTTMGEWAGGSGLVGRGHLPRVSSLEALKDFFGQATHKYDETPATTRALHVCFIVALVCVWYTFAVGLTLVNKSLLKEFPYPMHLTLIQLFFSMLFDLVLFAFRGSFCPLSRKVFVQLVPIALAMVFNKVLTYMSYSHVPVSLTHTVKASSPLFNVFLAYWWLGERPRLPIVLALIPIAIGVSLATASDLNFQLLGFAAALMSTMVNVFQGLYIKRSMTSSVYLNPLDFHFFSALCALAVSAPYYLFAMGTSLLTSSSSVSVESASLSALSTAVPDSLPWFFASWSNLPLCKLVLSVCCNHLVSVSSIYVLSRLSSLSYQVVTTLKRVVIIGSSVLYFGNQITLLNGLGIVLSFIGFFFFQRNKKSVAGAVAGKSHRHALGSPRGPHAVQILGSAGRSHAAGSLAVSSTNLGNDIQV